MRDVVIHTAELVSTKEATDSLVKITDSTYMRSELKQGAHNTTHMDAEERTQLLRFIEYFQDLFDGTLG